MNFKHCVSNWKKSQFMLFNFIKRFFFPVNLNFCWVHFVCPVNTVCCRYARLIGFHYSKRVTRIFPSSECFYNDLSSFALVIILGGLSYFSLFFSNFSLFPSITMDCYATLIVINYF